MTSYEAQAITDQSFIAKVLVAIDKRVNCWLLDCMSREYRSGVDDSLVNFLDMQRAIRMNTFSFNLPPSIRNHSTKRKRKDDDPTEDTKKVVITNPSINPNWKLREGEDYKQVFAGKNCELRPIIEGKPACPRWNSRGLCFTTCPLSHAPLSGPNKAAYDKYCKRCRNE